MAKSPVQVTRNRSSNQYSAAEFTATRVGAHIKMKKTVLTFGLISGAILSIMMAVTVPFEHKIGYDHALIVGYTTMVVSFLLIFFGIRSYRDNVGGGAVRFGRAFSVGALIAVIASVCYVATWEVIFYKFTPDFFDKYSARVVAQTKASGATDAQVEAKRQELAAQAIQYKKPLVNIAYTFIEPFPVGLVFALVCAGILRKRREDGVHHVAFGAPTPSGEPT